MWHACQVLQKMENMKENPARLDAAKQLFNFMGVELETFYLTIGRYDGVVISEAPDDETATKLSVAVGSLGAVRTETLRAFTEEGYRQLDSELP